MSTAVCESDGNISIAFTLSNGCVQVQNMKKATEITWGGQRMKNINKATEVTYVYQENVKVFAYLDHRL